MNYLPGILLLLAPLTQGATPPAQEGEAPSTLAEQVVRRRLDGLWLSTLPAPELERGHLWVSLRVGAAFDPAERPGLTRLLAATILAGGSAEVAGEDWLAWLFERRASVDLEVREDELSFAVECAPDELLTTLEGLGAALTNPSYAGFEETRAAVVAEIREENATPEARLALAARRLAFRAGSPDGRAADPDALAGASVEELRALHAKLFRREHLSVGLCGPIEATQARKATTAAFGALAGGQEPLVRPPRIARFPLRLGVYILDDPAAERTHFSLVTRGRLHGSTEDVGVDVWAAAMMADGHNGLLGAAMKKQGDYRNLRFRTEPGWSLTGLFELGFDAPNAVARRTLDAALVEIDRNWNTEMDETFMELGRERTLAEMRSSSLDPVTVARRAVDLAHYGLPATYFEDRTEATAAADLKDVMRSIRRHLPLRRILILASGPADLLERELALVADTQVIPHEYEDSTTPEAAQAVERMLASLGGRERWAALETLYTEHSQDVYKQRDVEAMQVRVWMSLTDTRTRMEQTGFAAPSTMVINGERAWSKTFGGIEELSNHDYTRALLEQRVQAYSVLHRLASNDYVSAELEGDRLIARDELGELCWFRIGADGRPTAYGWSIGKADYELVVETWAEADGLQYIERAMFKKLGVVRRMQAFEPNFEPDPEIWARP